MCRGPMPAKVTDIGSSPDMSSIGTPKNSHGIPSININSPPINAISIAMSNTSHEILTDDQDEYKTQPLSNTTLSALTAHDVTIPAKTTTIETPTSTMSSLTSLDLNSPNSCCDHDETIQFKSYTNLNISLPEATTSRAVTPTCITPSPQPPSPQPPPPPQSVPLEKEKEERYSAKSVGKKEAGKLMGQMANFCKVYANTEGHPVADGSLKGGVFLRNVCRVFKDRKFVLNHRWTDIIFKIRTYTKRNATICGSLCNFTQLVEEEGTLERRIQFASKYIDMMSVCSNVSVNFDSDSGRDLTDMDGDEDDDELESRSMKVTISNISQTHKIAVLVEQLETHVIEQDRAKIVQLLQKTQKNEDFIENGFVILDKEESKSFRKLWDKVRITLFELGTSTSITQKKKIIMNTEIYHAKEFLDSDLYFQDGKLHDIVDLIPKCHEHHKIHVRNIDEWDACFTYGSFALNQVYNLQCKLCESIIFSKQSYNCKQCGYSLCRQCCHLIICEKTPISLDSPFTIIAGSKQIKRRCVDIRFNISKEMIDRLNIINCDIKDLRYELKYSCYDRRVQGLAAAEDDEEEDLALTDRPSLKRGARGSNGRSNSRSNKRKSKRKSKRISSRQSSKHASPKMAAVAAVGGNINGVHALGSLKLNIPLAEGKTSQVDVLHTKPRKTDEVRSKFEQIQSVEFPIQLKTDSNYNNDKDRDYYKNNSAVFKGQIRLIDKKRNVLSFFSPIYEIPIEIRHFKLKYNCLFTTLNGSGRFGPTQIDRFYQGQDHEFDTKLDCEQEGMQLFTVPMTGKWKITCYGAKGGDSILVAPSSDCNAKIDDIDMDMDNGDCVTRHRKCRSKNITKHKHKPKHKQRHKSNNITRNRNNSRNRNKSRNRNRNNSRSRNRNKNKMKLKHRLIGSNSTSKADNGIVAKGGKGARVCAIIRLYKNDIIKIVCGQMGETCSNGNHGGGGGGGTYFVLYKTGNHNQNYAQNTIVNQPLIIAAGGNGASACSYDYNAGESGAAGTLGGGTCKSIANCNGIDGLCESNFSSSPGRKKYGGYKTNGRGGRGASFKNDFDIFQSYCDGSGNGSDYNKCNPKSFLDGAMGGRKFGYVGCDGGFGGGGGSYLEGGAGGGYVGGVVVGNKQYNTYKLNGALSYNRYKDNRTTMMNSNGENNGNGKVEVEYRST